MTEQAEPSESRTKPGLGWGLRTIVQVPQVPFELKNSPRFTVIDTRAPGLTLSLAMIESNPPLSSFIRAQYVPEESCGTRSVTARPCVHANLAGCPRAPRARYSSNSSETGPGMPLIAQGQRRLAHPLRAATEPRSGRTATRFARAVASSVLRACLCALRSHLAGRAG